MDCGKFFRRAYKKGITVEAYPTPKEVKKGAKKGKAANKRKSAFSGGGAGAAHADQGVEMLSLGDGEDDLNALEAGDAAAPHDHYAEAAKEKKEAAERAAKEEDELEFIRDIKEMSGLWPSIDPKNSTWFDMSRKNWDTNTQEPAGKVRLLVRVFECIFVAHALCLLPFSRCSQGMRLDEDRAMGRGGGCARGRRACGAQPFAVLPAAAGAPEVHAEPLFCALAVGWPRTIPQDHVLLLPDHIRTDHDLRGRTAADGAASLPRVTLAGAVMLTRLFVPPG